MSLGSVSPTLAESSEAQDAPRPLRWQWYADSLAFVLALGAVLAASWVALYVFEGLPHLEDEMATLWQAEIIADGEIYLESPPSPLSFLVPFVVDHDGRRFGKYPPGWPATLSLGVRAGAPWLVNPLLAGLSVWLVYRLGSKVRGRGVGLLSAALTASSPMFWMLSGSLMGHSQGLFLALAFALAWLDLFPARGAPSRGLPGGLLIAVAGLSLGLLVLTRPLTAVGVALPCVAHGLCLMVSGAPVDRRRGLAVALVAVGVSALLPIWQAALTGNPWLNPYTLWWPYDRLGFGAGVGRTETGHNLTWVLINTRFSLRAGLHDLFGWPYLSWLFLPLGLLALRRNRDGLLLLAVLPSLILVYAFYWIGSWLLGPRYYYEALPGLAIASAGGILWSGNWLAAQRGGWNALRRAATALAVALLMSLNLAYYIPLRVGGMYDLYGISRARLEPLQEATSGPALVFVHPTASWTEYGTLLTLTPPFSEGDLIVVYARGAETDAKVAALYPDRPHYHYYPDEPGRLYTAPR
jgi:4-amino-4-deoxy-L-arabinose transferase-like glycosyltransferase